MIRNIITYMVIILMMSGVFAFYTRSLSEADDSYDKVNTKMYSVDESSAYVETLSYNFNKAVVAKTEDVNKKFFEDKGIDCFYALLINDTDKRYWLQKMQTKGCIRPV